MTVSYKALYEIRLQSFKCNAKWACIFYLILVVISSSLTLPINSREGGGGGGGGGGYLTDKIPQVWQNLIVDGPLGLFSMSS